MTVSWRRKAASGPLLLKRLGLGAVPLEPSSSRSGVVEAVLAVLPMAPPAAAKACGPRMRAHQLALRLREALLEERLLRLPRRVGAALLPLALAVPSPSSLSTVSSSVSPSSLSLISVLLLAAAAMSEAVPRFHAKCTGPAVEGRSPSRLSRTCDFHRSKSRPRKRVAARGVRPLREGGMVHSGTGR